MLGVESKKNPAKWSFRALVADDDPGGRKLVEMTLAKLNFDDIHVVSDGLEAWKAIEAADVPFDIIIADWHMPFATGMELLEQVRESGMDIPFIMLTGETVMESVIQAKESNVTAYITKPISPQRLTLKVSEILPVGGGR